MSMPAAAKTALNAAANFVSRPLPVSQQESQPVGVFVECHQEIAGLLGDPGCGGVGGDADDVDLPGGQFQEEQHVQALEENRVDGEEVAGHDRVGLGGEELFPGRAGAAGCRVDAGLVQDLPDRAGGDGVAEADQFAVYAAVAPGGVLGCQAEDQGADRRVDGWSAAVGMGVGQVAGDQLAVPAKQGSRGDEERRPTRPGEQAGQGCQDDPVGGLQVGAVDLAMQDRDLVAQHQQLHVLGAVLGAAVAGELGQHLQDLPQQEVHHRGAHEPDHRSRRGRCLAQTRTSRPPPTFRAPHYGKASGQLLGGQSDRCGRQRGDQR